MKKLLSLGIVVLLNTMCVFAQDVIFRSSTDSIQAQVLTIGTTEITYRKWSNLEGPIYSISINEVAAVRYANGTYDFFSNKSAVTPENFQQSSSIMLTRSGNTYIYGNQVMNMQAMLAWLKDQNCPVAYEQFSSGLHTSNVGWFMLAIGAGVDLAGCIILARNGNRVAGGVLVGVGSALEIACIPTIIVGYSKMHQTVDVYNATCGATAQVKPYWALQVSNNGLGIAYNF